MLKKYIYRGFVRNIFAAFACIGVLVYFGAHGILGERGWSHWSKLKTEVSFLQHKFDVNNNIIDSLEHRVSLLRDNSLDLDLLDERARQILGVAGTNEILVLRR